MADIHTEWIRPFKERNKLFPSDFKVIGLIFNFDKRIISILKDVFKECRNMIDRDRLITSPGGWLSNRKQWFVKPEAWPRVKQALIENHYTVAEWGLNYEK